MTTNASLLERRLAAVPRGVATACPVFAARAEGSELWDAERRRYIDFAAGIAVLNTGHRHPRVMAAVQAQLAAYTHTAFQVVAYEPYVALAERLNALAPIGGATKTIFFTTGAEATENAVKIARVATKRSAVIAFAGGFHGRTLLATALTGKVLPYKRGYGPLPGEVYHVPFPIDHYGYTLEDSLRGLEMLLAADVEPENVAAIIIEPVQGEGGFHEAPRELLQALRSLCHRHGIMLIADEVQTGFGRTGQTFAIQHSGVEADLIAVAKSLGGGFPISGVIGRAEIMDAAEPGGLGGTYAGPPIACAAALAVLDILEDEGLPERANMIGARVKERLEALERQTDLRPIASVRGPGAMIAFDAVKERGGHEPDPVAARAITMRALEEGLILLNCGIYGETVRLLMPLTTPLPILEEGLDMLGRALRVGS